MHRSTGKMAPLPERVPATSRWSVVETSGEVPEGRYKHGACVFGDHMFVMGGYSVQWLNDVRVLNLITKRWTTFSNSNAAAADDERDIDSVVDGMVPRPRESHTVTLISSFVYVHGGWSWPNTMNDMYRFSASRIVRQMSVQLSRRNSLEQKKKITNSTSSSSSSSSTAAGGSSKAQKVVRKVPSKGSIMLTELNSVGGEKVGGGGGGALNGLMVTGSRRVKTTRKSEEDGAIAPDSPLFRLRNKAFRSTSERKKRASNNEGGLRRSDSNLLAARTLSSPLPNILQLTRDSDDSDDEESGGGSSGGGGGGGLARQRSREGEVLQLDEVLSSPHIRSSSGGGGGGGGDDTQADATSTPPPARSSLSPVKRAAASRRREYQRMRGSMRGNGGDGSGREGGGGGDTATMKSYRGTGGRGMRAVATQGSSSNFGGPVTSYSTTLDEKQRLSMRKEVQRRVEVALEEHQSSITKQEQKRTKAVHGMKALSDMLLQLDAENEQLRGEIHDVEEEKKKTFGAADSGRKAFQQAYDMDIEIKIKVKNSHRAVEESRERIQLFQQTMQEHVASKKRIADMSSHLNQKIQALKQQIQREEDHQKEEPEDGINESIHKLTQVVEEQGETRRKLTSELNLLKKNQSLLQEKIQDQMNEFQSVTQEETELRNKVEAMVYHLAGESFATEEKPYEKLSASMFGTSLSNDSVGGMMISR